MFHSLLRWGSKEVHVLPETVLPLSLEDKGCLVVVDPPLTLLAPWSGPDSWAWPKKVAGLQFRCSVLAASPETKGERGQGRGVGSSQDAEGKFPAYSYCPIVWG